MSHHTLCTLMRLRSALDREIAATLERDFPEGTPVQWLCGADLSQRVSGTMIGEADMRAGPFIRVRMEDAGKSTSASIALWRVAAAYDNPPVSGSDE